MPDPITIITRRLGPGRYLAKVHGELGLKRFGQGTTPAEAVGLLLTLHGRELGVDVLPVGQRPDE